MSAGGRRCLRVWAQETRGWQALAVAAGAAGGGAVIAQAGLIAWVVDAVVVGGRAPATLAPAFAGLAAAALARPVLDWLRQAAGIAAAARARRCARTALTAQLGRLGPVRLAGYHSADLAGRAVEQVDALEGYFARYRPQAAIAAVVPVAVGVVALGRDWVAGVLLFAAAPLIPLFMALVGIGAEHLHRRQFVVQGRLAGHFLDRVRGLVTLELFGAGGRAVDEVAAASDAYRRYSMRPLRVAFLSSAVLEFFAAVAIAVVAIYVGFGLLGYIGFGPAPELTLFSGLFVLLLAPEFFQPLRTLSQHYHDRAAALGAAEGIAEVLDVPAEAVPAAGPAHAAASVRARGVRVSLPGRGKVLRGVDLDAAPGEKVVIAGPSGSGKSTLLHVLAGFVVPDAGEVTVAGGPPGVPARCAWLGQRPYIQRAPIATNIRLAAPDADDAAVRAAAGAAGVMAFARALPDGLESTVGERGHDISGGQAQRIALARALLAPAPVLLLDEPTTALDVASQAHALAALDRLAAAGRTLVIASHDVRVHALADRVVALADGRGPGAR